MPSFNTKRIQQPGSSIAFSLEVNHLKRLWFLLDEDKPYYKKDGGSQTNL